MRGRSEPARMLVGGVSETGESAEKMHGLMVEALLLQKVSAVAQSQSG